MTDYVTKRGAHNLYYHPKPDTTLGNWLFGVLVAGAMFFLMFITKTIWGATFVRLMEVMK